MISGLPPSQGDYSNYSAQDPSEQWLISQMENFEKELRADMGPPTNTAALEKLLPQMQAFLEKNKSALYNLMEQNGFPQNGAFSITNEFDASINCLQDYLQDPTSPDAGGALDLLNESMTQLNYYLNNKNT